MTDSRRHFKVRALGLGALAAFVTYGALVVAYWGEGKFFLDSGDVPFPSPLVVAATVSWIPALLWGGAVSTVVALVSPRSPRRGRAIGLAMTIVPLVVLPVLDWRFHLGDTELQRMARLREEARGIDQPGGLAEFLRRHPLHGVVHRRSYEAGDILTSGETWEALRSARPLAPEDVDALEAEFKPSFERGTVPLDPPERLFVVVILERLRTAPLSRLFERWPGFEYLVLRTATAGPEGIELLQRHLAARPGEAEAIRRTMSRRLSEAQGLEADRLRNVWIDFEVQAFEAGRADRAFAPCATESNTDRRSFCIDRALRALLGSRERAEVVLQLEAVDWDVLESRARELLASEDRQWHDIAQRTLDRRP